MKVLKVYRKLGGTIADLVTFKHVIKMHRVKSSRIYYYYYYYVSLARLIGELSTHAIPLSLCHGFDEEYAVLK